MAGASLSEAEISELVHRRELFRQAKSWAEADFVREQLKSAGVELYDREHEWRSKDGRKGPLPHAGPSTSPLTEAQIMEHVQAREEARVVKDFSRADAIRDELRGMGVDIYDKDKLWRTTDGRQGPYPGLAPPTDTAVGSTLQVQLPGAEPSDEDILEALQAREAARASKDFQHADNIRLELKRRGVDVFDKQGTWRTASGRQGTFVPSNLGGGSGVNAAAALALAQAALPTHTTQMTTLQQPAQLLEQPAHLLQCALGELEILEIVRLREEARAQKDYTRADAIKEEIRKLGIEIFDTNLTWRSLDGRTGSWASVGRAGAPPRPSAGAKSWEDVAGPDMRPPDLRLQQLPQLQQQQPVVACANGSNGRGAANNGMLSTASIEALLAGLQAARVNLLPQDGNEDPAMAIRQDLHNHSVQVNEEQRTWGAGDGSGRMGLIAPLQVQQATPAAAAATGGQQQQQLLGAAQPLLGAQPQLTAAYPTMPLDAQQQYLQIQQAQLMQGATMQGACAVGQEAISMLQAQQLAAYGALPQAQVGSADMAAALASGFATIGGEAATQPAP